MRTGTRIWTVIVAVLACAMLAGMAGCAAVDPAQARDAREAVGDVQARAGDHVAAAVRIAALAAADEMTPERAAAEVARILAALPGDAAALAEVKRQAEEGGVPWWYWALLASSAAGSAVAGAAGTYAGKVRPYAEMLKAVITGVERAGLTNVKAEIQGAATERGVGGALHRRVKEQTG